MKKSLLSLIIFTLLHCAMPTFSMAPRPNNTPPIEDMVEAAIWELPQQLETYREQLANAMATIRQLLPPQDIPLQLEVDALELLNVIARQIEQFVNLADHGYIQQARDTYKEIALAIRRLIEIRRSLVRLKKDATAAYSTPSLAEVGKTTISKPANAPISTTGSVCSAPASEQQGGYATFAPKGATPNIPAFTVTTTTHSFHLNNAQIKAMLNDFLNLQHDTSVQITNNELSDSTLYATAIANSIKQGKIAMAELPTAMLHIYQNLLTDALATNQTSQLSAIAKGVRAEIERRNIEIDSYTPILTLMTPQELQVEEDSREKERLAKIEEIAQHEPAKNVAIAKLNEADQALAAYDRSFRITNYLHDKLPWINKHADYVAAKLMYETQIKDHIKEQLKLQAELDQITMKKACAHRKIALTKIIEDSTLPQDYRDERLKALNDSYNNCRKLHSFKFNVDNDVKSHLSSLGFNPAELESFNGNALAERLVSENLGIIIAGVHQTQTKPEDIQLLDLTTTTSIAAIHAAKSYCYQLALHLTESAYHMEQRGIALIEGACAATDDFAETLLHPITSLTETAKGISQIVTICLRDAINQENINTLLLGQATGQLTNAQRQELIDSLDAYCEECRQFGEALQTAWEATCAQGTDTAVCRGIGYTLASLIIMPKAITKAVRIIGNLPIIQRSLELVNTVATRQKEHMLDLMLGANFLIDIETASPQELKQACTDYRQFIAKFRANSKHVGAITCTDEQVVKAATSFNEAIEKGVSKFTREVETAGPKAITPTLGQDQLTFNEANAKHIFINKSGHLPDTPQNRQLILDMASEISNYYPKPDMHGNLWCAKTLPDGTQLWASIREGQIRNCGHNQTPINWNPQTGLAKLIAPKGGK